MTVPKAESTDMVNKTAMERGRDDSSSKIRRYAVRIARCTTREFSGTDVHSTRVPVFPPISGASRNDGFAFARSTKYDREWDICDDIHALGRGFDIVRVLCSNRSYLDDAWCPRALFFRKSFSIRSDADRRFRLHRHTSQFDRHRYWNASSNVPFLINSALSET